MLMKTGDLRPGEEIMMDGFRDPVKFLSKEARNGKKSYVYIFQCAAWMGQNGLDDEGVFELTGRQVGKLCDRAKK